MNYRTEYGIDTVNFYSLLTSKESFRLIARLRERPKFVPEKEDYINGVFCFTSFWLSSKGIRISVSKRGPSPWGLSVILHPTALLGDDDPTSLYVPSGDSFRAFTTQADKLMEPLELPCPVHKMTVTRVDVTANIRFDSQEIVDQYIRILKRSCIIPHYKQDKLRAGDVNLTDYAMSNSRLHKQCCKRASIFIYDKSAQLKSLKRHCKIPGPILRIECQLRRGALRKHLGKKCLSSSFAILKAAGERSPKIIRWYIGRLQPEGEILRYHRAMELAGTVKGRKNRERMEYLLRKVSDCKNVTAALEKLKSKYGLKSGQVTRVLNKFESLGISPITLGDRTSIDTLPGVQELLSGKKK